MKVKIIEYREDKNDCIGIIDGHMVVVDPFVGCAIETNDDNYKEIGKSIVGKTFEMPDDVLFCHNCFCPSENEFKEI
jgi:alanine dehydrogenase